MDIDSTFEMLSNLKTNETFIYPSKEIIGQLITSSDILLENEELKKHKIIGHKKYSSRLCVFRYEKDGIYKRITHIAFITNKLSYNFLRFYKSSKNIDLADLIVKLTPKEIMAIIQSPTIYDCMSYLTDNSWERQRFNKNTEKYKELRKNIEILTKTQLFSSFTGYKSEITTNFPGGQPLEFRRENGNCITETPLKTARREFEEEVGKEVKVQILINNQNLNYSGDFISDFTKGMTFKEIDKEYESETETLKNNVPFFIVKDTEEIDNIQRYFYNIIHFAISKFSNFKITNPRKIYYFNTDYNTETDKIIFFPISFFTTKKTPELFNFPIYDDFKNILTKFLMKKKGAMEFRLKEEFC